MTVPILGGKPLKFPTPATLAKEMNKYFKDTPKEEWTVTGLCLAMGTTRETLDDYQVRDTYKGIVKQAKLMVENSYELSLRKNGRAGDKFALKNFGWSDKQEQQITGKDGADLLPVIQVMSVKTKD